MWWVHIFHKFVMQYIHREHEQLPYLFTLSIIMAYFDLRIAIYCKLFIGNLMVLLYNIVKWSWLFLATDLWWNCVRQCQEVRRYDFSCQVRGCMESRRCVLSVRRRQSGTVARWCLCGALGGTVVGWCLCGAPGGTVVWLCHGCAPVGTVALWWHGGAPGGTVARCCHDGTPGGMATRLRHVDGKWHGGTVCQVVR